jgi:L-alanine-DL-glutamate epimerase-like enolase superfamily enzyme
VAIDQVDVLVGVAPGADPMLDIVQDVVIVRVRGSGGLEGFGETQSSPRLVKAVIEAPASRTLARGVKDVVLGATLDAPADIDRLLGELADATRIVGGTGVVVHALSALEHALWDLLGRQLQVPAWKLAAPEADPIHGPRAYATFWAPAEDELHALAETVQDRGLAGVKVAYTRAGPPGGDEAAYLRRLRAEIGPTVDLMVDLQQRGSLDGISRMLEAYADTGISWIEEPFAGDRTDLYEQLAARSPVRLAAGETMTSFDGFERLLAAGVRVVQPDLGRCGGLRAAQPIARSAAAAGAVAVPHCWSTGLNRAVSVHWAVATGNDLVERCSATSPLPGGLVLDAPELADGRFAVPDRPGLGTSVDTALLAEAVA